MPSIRGSLKFLCGFVCTASTVIATAQPASQPSSDIQRGSFHTTFTDQSPLSSIEAQNKRYHLKIEPSEKYDLSQESFEVSVPEDYDPQRPSGVFVWINAAESGHVPQEWLAIFAKQHLICIGANNSGNPRPIGIRIALALDAAYNMKKIYNIDDSRVYLSGVSGGAKVASMVGIIYPEIFTGTIPMVGVSYYRNVDSPTNPAMYYPALFPKPPLPMFDRAKQRSRFVLITGPNDMNRDPIQATYKQGFLADGFQHVQYVEVPGTGHQPASAEVLDQAIATMDAVLVSDAPKNFEKAQSLAKAGKISEARPLYAEVARHGSQPLAQQAQQELMDLPLNDAPTTAQSAQISIPAKKVETAESDRGDINTDERDAQSLYSLAENYERNKLYNEARLRLEKILTQHPNTQAAIKAKVLMDRIKSEQQ